MFNHPFKVSYYKKPKELEMYLNEEVNHKQYRLLNKKVENDLDNYIREPYEEFDATMIYYEHEKLKKSLLIDKILYGDIFYNRINKKIYVFGFTKRYYGEVIKDLYSLDRQNSFLSIGFQIYKYYKDEGKGYYNISEEEYELIDVLYDESIMKYFQYIGNIYLHKNILDREINESIGSLSINKVIKNQYKVYFTINIDNENTENICYDTTKTFDDRFLINVFYNTSYHTRFLKESVFEKINTIKEDTNKLTLTTPVTLTSGTIFCLKEEVINEIKNSLKYSDYKEIIERFLIYYEKFIMYIDNYGELIYYSLNKEKEIPSDAYNLISIHSGAYKVIHPLTESYDKEFLKFI